MTTAHLPSPALPRRQATPRRLVPRHSLLVRVTHWINVLCFSLLLMSGDTISPSVESITYKGQQMIEAWNMIGLDYATFGNHEFDFGPDVLRERMRESKFG